MVWRKNPSGSRLKSAYKKLALEFHPDRNPGDPDAERRFKEVVIAHETLQNPKRPGLGGTPRGRNTTRQRGEYEGKMGRTFSPISSRTPVSRRMRKKPKSRDLHAQVEVTLEELTRDSEKEIPASRRVRCASCEGLGFEAGARTSACPACKGAGRGALQAGTRGVMGSLLRLRRKRETHGRGVRGLRRSGRHVQAGEPESGDSRRDQRGGSNQDQGQRR